MNAKKKEIDILYRELQRLKHSRFDMLREYQQQLKNYDDREIAMETDIKRLKHQIGQMKKTAKLDLNALSEALPEPPILLRRINTPVPEELNT